MPYVYRKSNPEESNLFPSPSTIPGQQAIPQPKPSLTTMQQNQSTAYPERILRKIQTAQQYDCQYIPTSEDIKEIEFEKYKQVFKNTLVHDVRFLRRIKEESGKEFLVYRYEDTITDDSGTSRAHGYYAGFITEQVPNIKRNALREITDVTFDREKIVYTIPFSPEAVEQAIATADNVPSDFASGVRLKVRLRSLERQRANNPQHRRLQEISFRSAGGSKQKRLYTQGRHRHT